MKAGDQFDLCAEDTVERHGEHVGIGALTFAREQRFRRRQIPPRPGFRREPGQAQARLVRHAADPGEAGRVEAGVAKQQRREWLTASNRADHRAIPWGDVIEELRGLQTSRSLHVLRHQ
jgi:hypothetical protein